MRTIFLISIALLFFHSGSSQVQTISLTFLAKDSTGFLSLDSVYIQNTTTGKDTVIKGNNQIILFPSLGIDDPNPSRFSILSPFPNPSDKSSTVLISIVKTCNLTITLSNIQGKVVWSSKYELNSGIHEFRIQTSIKNLALLNITDGISNKSMKLINHNTSTESNDIIYIGRTNRTAFKSTYSLDFEYHFGDQLVFRSFKNKYLESMLSDSPYHDTAYTFNLIAFTFPFVTTDSVMNITNTTALCGGEVISDGGSPVTSRGVCWSKNSNPTISNSHTVDGDSIGHFISNISGLSGNTIYYIRSYASNSIGTSYGNEISFTTLPNPFQCGQNVLYEGISYSTVQIGNRCWFRKNLNVGVVGEQINDGIIQKDCFSADLNNCNVYGGLYKWDEMMKYNSNNGGQGICPTGWHIPTLTEWNTTINFIGAGLGNTGGYKMKEAGYTHWLEPNTWADNSSGFTALGAGAFFPPSSQWPGYNHLKMRTYFWTSTLFDTNSPYYYYLSYDDVVIRETHEYDKNYFYSVRCIKNYP